MIYLSFIKGLSCDKLPRVHVAYCTLLWLVVTKNGTSIMGNNVFLYKKVITQRTKYSERFLVVHRLTCRHVESGYKNDLSNLTKKEK